MGAGLSPDLLRFLTQKLVLVLPLVPLKKSEIKEKMIIIISFIIFFMVKETPDVCLQFCP